MKIEEKHVWKKRIALDIDGTLWDFYTPFFEFYNNKYGTDFKLEDFRGDLPQLLETTQEKLNFDFEEFEGSEYCNDLPLYEEVYENLLKLSQKYFFVLITAKSEKHRDVVMQRLQKKFPKFDFPIYFSGDYVGASGGKDAICRETGCEMIIEDSFSNALSCSKAGIKSILLHRYWNQEFEAEGVVRVNDWNEVVRILDSE